ncbi:unnamed protein product [Diatraea saccharalis]|uniref:Zinc finger CCHC domain-containing protein 7 n=1 Tax=Diatraea saccharalis TaxID=40085 RepID=A0A9N9RGN6_9NEOP|nr:unnamed protein product [Diatraea saccharalis]
MDEEPNEHELEERLYAMLHHVDETQANTNITNQNETLKIVENVPRSTFRRYWRTSGDQPTQFQKINSPKENVSSTVNKNLTTKNTNNSISNPYQEPKEEKCGTEETVPTIDLSLFQSPPQNVKKTIEILPSENVQSVVLESSDEDEVIEVELPPKPTITIGSSDEDEVCIVSKQGNKTNNQNGSKPQAVADNTTLVTDQRGVSASPVPSVVSSVSDEFIRGDCIALNISSKSHENHSFDFSLHGLDLLGQVTPSKKKRKKKSKESATSTPIPTAQIKTTCLPPDACFATPKSKAKKKKQKSKSYIVSKMSIPSADVYDSDSNQSGIDTNKNQIAYSVTEKSLPNTDVYESDSSQPEPRNKTKTAEIENVVDSSDSFISLDIQVVESDKNSKKNVCKETQNKLDSSIVDLTDSDNYITLDSTHITEDISMANVSGFQESTDYGDEPVVNSNNAPILGSTKVPQILLENLDFGNLKGKDNVCKTRKYSLTNLRAEMEKFYNESWGGENFNHREIQKYMSRDKSLWVIDPKDKIPALSKRKVTCQYCNRSGHRDDTCRMKPPVCYMCGTMGHYEPRCPSKICVNCGSPNHMYSTMCRNCAWWSTLTCAECGQRGHPPSHCPDLWRRYHNTIDNNTPLVTNWQTKKSHQLYCSGCTRRGHLVHACRVSLPFSGLPINSPYVAFYRPIYMPDSQDPTSKAQQEHITATPINARPDRNKRQSKSPTMHENHMNKKKNITVTEITEEKTKNDDMRPRKNSVGKNIVEDGTKPKNVSTIDVQPNDVLPAPDFIPIGSSANHDKKGHMIQDNEVSGTTDVVTTARIYVTTDVVENIKSDDGAKWLKDTVEKLNVTVENSDCESVLSIKGKVADQEAFQRELREWTRQKPNTEITIPTRGDGVQQTDEETKILTENIPKKKWDLLRKLSTALDSLNSDLGDPEAMYEELNYLQNRHEQLLNQKVISTEQLLNNKRNINGMMKKLNMVLLGQMGLAGGKGHLSELYSLQKKITNVRKKTVPLNLRIAVGMHYRTIFTPLPREDYADLLIKCSKKRHKTLHIKNKVQFGAKKRNRTRKNSAGLVRSLPVPPVLKQPVQKGNQTPVVPEFHSQPSTKRPLAVGKLVFYHKRIVNSRPADGALRKERTNLVRNLHSQIACLKKNENISPKAMKKVKKIQARAQMFLSNV